MGYAEGDPLGKMFHGFRAGAFRVWLDQGPQPAHERPLGTRKYCGVSDIAQIPDKQRRNGSNGRYAISKAFGNTQAANNWRKLMKVFPLVVGACLFTTGALAQSVAEMQKLDDEWAAAFNKGDIATVANLYKDDAVVFPPGGDMVKGKPAIQSFFTEAQKGIQADHFKVTDVRALGPDAAR